MLNTTHIGDCRDTLRIMLERGITAQMCVTSPPYFGLRDYGHYGQIGLEQTPDAYVAELVSVFRDVRNVLRDDGTLWLNLGDSYTAHPGQRKTTDKAGAKQNTNSGSNSTPSRHVGGLPAKNLIGIPWRVALALQADGWYLRQDIIWHKPNPMPESVTDRCTKAHEYIFMLTKSPRYYFDSEAIREPAVTDDRPRSSWTDRKLSEPSRRGDPGASGHVTTTGTLASREGRNRRSVWTVNTKPYNGAHFAVFPPALIEPCVLASSRPNDVVLDPFMGSGTTAQVAVQHGRQFIGCELNGNYAPLQARRLSGLQMGFPVQTGGKQL